jgi:opacity protein-like surface antigen
MIKRFMILGLAVLLGPPVLAQLKLDLEGGLVFGTNYNEIAVSGLNGTRVDISDQLDVKPQVFYRLRAGYSISGRHHVSLLYAPLQVRYNGVFGQGVNFNNTYYAPTQDLKVNYKFNSYRLTYRYDFLLTGRWRVGAGLTAKIRDADIRYTSASNDSHFSNVGFVPLLNFYAGYKPLARWTAIIEGDALASKYGRAEDIFAGLAYQMNTNVAVKLGYRVVEGGADNDKIHNFTWINYASAGLLISF